MPRWRLIAHGTSEPGIRERNEDAFGLSSEPPLLIVADGMGGNGRLAAELAVRTVMSSLADASAPTDDRVRRAVLAANQAVLALARSESHLLGIGTTLALVLLEDGRAHIAHCGNSRVYLIRQGSIEQLTSDHTLLAMIRAGEISTSELGGVDLEIAGNILMRAIGLLDEVEVTQRMIELCPGDRLLACTDGLSHALPEDTLARIIHDAGDDLPRACEQLLREARARGARAWDGTWRTMDDVAMAMGRVETA